jgi:hypothetical protein
MEKLFLPFVVTKYKAEKNKRKKGMVRGIY